MITREEIAKVVLSSLTPKELSDCVVYLSRTLIPTGQIEFPRIMIDVPRQSYIAFVDREPMANWSHSSRYILVNSESAETKSIEAEYPPFQSSYGIKWGLLYKAPSVSNDVVTNVEKNVD